MSDAVVLFSGGQDSTTCLAWAIETWGKGSVFPVSFAYGQRHAIELEQARKICEIFECQPPQIIPVEALSMFGTAALTNAAIEVELKASEESLNMWAHEHGLPSTFVPGRNLLFFTLAAAYAAMHGIRNLVTGICQTDSSGYPDCREVFRDAAEEAINKALDDKFTIHAPLLTLSKAHTWALAEQLGVLEVVIEYSHTCYHGDRSGKFAWGRGCGTCPACLERTKGWDEYQAKYVAA